MGIGNLNAFRQEYFGNPASNRGSPALRFTRTAPAPDNAGTTDRARSDSDVFLHSSHRNGEASTYSSSAVAAQAAALEQTVAAIGQASAESAHAGQQAARVNDVATAEGRQEAAKDYDAILRDLRAQYGESEAMRLFDEIMRADGYELKSAAASSNILFGLTSNAVSGFADIPAQVLGGVDFDVGQQLAYNTDCNLHLQSILNCTMMDGNVETAAESWLVYGASRPYSQELQDYWQNRYRDNADAGFAVDAYLDALPNAAQRSFVEANGDLGTLVAGILRENGVELASGQYIDFEVGADLNGLPVIHVNSNCGTYLTDMFNNNAEFKSALLGRAQTPPIENVSGLPGQLGEESRSIEYSVQRYFSYSADEPSVVVANDFLGVNSTGYTYVKKAGDYFDPNSDSQMISAGIVAAETFEMDAGQVAGAYKTTKNTLNSMLRESVESGDVFEGSMSFDEMENRKRVITAERGNAAGDGLTIARHKDEVEWLEKRGHAVDVATAEGRQEAAKNYDEILKDLRERHGEEEAMRLFDEIMRADGFERIEYGGSGIGLALGSGVKEAMTGLPRSSLIMGVSSDAYTEILSRLNRDDAGADMILYSTLKAETIDGRAEVAAESWAVYGASRPYSEDLRAYWQGRYKDSVQSGADFDVDAYMNRLPDSGQRSAVAADAELGDMIAGILRENGIELESGVCLEFEFTGDNELVVRGASGRYNEIFGANPDFIAAVRTAMSAPPVENVSRFNVSDADRTVEYSVTRSVAFSADEPSVAMVNDYLGAASAGYVYAKKTGDYFDPNAGGYSVLPQTVIQGLAEPEARVECENAISALLAEAARTGRPVAGSVPMAALEQAREEKAAAFHANRDSTPMYESGSDTPIGWHKTTGEGADHAVPASSAPAGATNKTAPENRGRSGAVRQAIADLQMKRAARNAYR